MAKQSPKILVIPASKVRQLPVTIRADGTVEQVRTGTLLEADDGSLVEVVSGIQTGVPDEEDDTAGVNKRKAYSGDFSDAAMDTVKSKIAAAVVGDTLPPNWKAKKAKL